VSADTSPERSLFRHWDTVTVRWADMDAIGHVNHAKYFTYCESARWHYFERLGMAAVAAPGVGPSLVRATLDFRRQVHYPATLVVGVRAVTVGRSSFTLDYGLYLEPTDQLVAHGSSVLVWTDYAAGRSLSLPAALRQAISDLEGRSLES
jgi:acyl-CoA thioester hydrolase